MRTILHIVAAYVSADYELTEDNLCTVKVRGEDTRYLPIDEVLENFYNIPHVKGCGGIMNAYTFNTETKETTYLELCDRLKNY